MKTDVELIIRARNEASAAVLAVSDALKTLTGAQETVAQGGRVTSSVLEQLQGATTALAGAFEKIDDAAGRAERAFATQQATLAETKAQLESVNAQMEAAEQVAQKLGVAISVLDKERARPFTIQLKAVQAAQRDLTGQSERLTAAVTKQETAIGQSRSALQQLGSTANAAEGAVKAAADTTAAAMEREAAQAREAAIALNRVASALPPITPAAREAASAVNSAWTSFKGFVGSLLVVPDAARRAEAAMAAHAASTHSTLNLTQQLSWQIRYMVANYVGLYAAIQRVSEVLQTYITFQSVQNRLGVAFGQNAQKVSAEIGWLRDQSLRLGMSFSVLSDEYSKFAIASMAANYSSENTRRIFLSVAEAARVSQLTTDQLKGVFLALTKMMSKGKITSEELRRQLGDRLSGAFVLFADALGLTTAQLDNLMRKGEVFATETNLSKVADELTKKYGPQLGAALESVSAQIGRMQASMEMAQLAVANGGFIKALADALTLLNNYFQSRSGQQFFTDLGTAMGRIVGLVPILVRNFDLITLAFKAWLTFKISQYFVDLYVAAGRATAGIAATRAQLVGMTVAVNMMAATSVGAARVALTALGVAMVTLQGVMVRVAAVARAMWVAVGGPVGIAFIGITMLLQWLLGKWLTGVDDATAALREHDRILTEVRNGYEEAAGKVDKWASKIKNVTQFEVLQAGIKALQDARDAMDDMKSPRAPFGTDLRKIVPELEKAINAFKAGTMSAEQFRQKVSALGVQYGGEITPKYIQDLIDASRRYEDAKKQAAEYSAVLRVLRGQANDTDRALLGLSGASGTTPAQSFQQALEDRIKSWNAETEAMKQNALAKQKQYQIDQAIRQAAQDAAQAKTTLTDKNKQDIAAAVGAKFDAEHANDKAPKPKVDEAAQFHQALQDRIDAWKDEAAAVAAATQQKQRAFQIEQAITQAEKEAKRAGTELSDAERENIRKTVGGLYDAQHAAEAVQKAVDNAIGLSDQRQTAIQELQNAIQEGEPSEVIEKIRSKIQDLTVQLGPAVLRARELAAALGGEESQRMIAALDKIDLKLKAIKVGLTDAKQMNQMIAGGLTTAFDRFAESVSNGRNVFTSLWDSFRQFAADFLRQIAQMILKQTLLNLLAKTNIGGWLSKTINKATGTAGNDDGDTSLATAGTTLTVAGDNLNNAASRLTEAADAMGSGGDGALSGGDGSESGGGLGSSQSSVDELLKTGSGGGLFGTIDSMINKLLGSFGGLFSSITNLVSGLLGGSGSGGIFGMLGSIVGALFHSGGRVSNPTGQRSVSAAIFAGAQRLHRGGIPGLGPKEVPAILENDEEVLKRSDPRHILNGGGRGAQASPPQVALKVVNAFDSGDMVSKGLNTDVGEQAFLNFVRSNASAVNAALNG